MTETERIVVGVDGSPTSQEALRWALQQARLRHASVEVVHAWEVPYFGGYPYSAAPADAETYERAAAEVLDRAVDAEDTQELTVTRMLRPGSAARALLDAAKGAAMVVVGSRGLGGFAGLLLGSVSQQVTHHAECPVVIVPATGEIDDGATDST